MIRARWLVAAAGVLLVVAAGWWWLKRGAGEQPRYRTVALEVGTIESTVSATGTVNPVEQVEVGSQVSGTLARLDADYNARVRRGQVLAQIEPSSFRARLLQAEANVARAEVAVRDARRSLERARELVKDNYISQADLDAADLASAQRQADLKQAKAAFEVARVDLDNTTIRAPIDGVVISRSVDLGQTVAASLQAPRLFVIANDLTRMQVETRIDEADIGRIRQGLRATFTVDAFPELEFEGEVNQVRLEPIVEQNVVTYTTVVRTGNPDLRLRPGMTANVTLHVDRRDGVLRVPNAALRFAPPAGRGGAPSEPGQAMAAPGGAGAGASGGEAMGRRGGRPGGTGEAPAEGRAGRDRPGASADPGVLRSERAGAGDPGRWRGSGGGDAEARRKMRPGAGEWRRPGAPEGAGGSPGGPVVRRTVAEDLYVFRGGAPVAVAVATGITDGTFTEVQSDQLRPGDLVIVGLEQPRQRANLQPPPGMGGGGFGGPGRRR